MSRVLSSSAPSSWSWAACVVGLVGLVVVVVTISVV